MKLKKFCLLLTCILGICILSGCTADELTASQEIQEILNTDCVSVSGTLIKNDETILKYTAKTDISDNNNPYIKLTIDDIKEKRTDNIILNNQKIYSSPWFFVNKILKDANTPQEIYLKNMFNPQKISPDTIIESDSEIFNAIHLINTISEDIGESWRYFLSLQPQTYKKNNYIEKNNRSLKITMTGEEFLKWIDFMHTSLETNSNSLRIFMNATNDNNENINENVNEDVSLFSQEDNIQYVLNKTEELKPTIEEQVQKFGTNNFIQIEILKQNQTYHLIITINDENKTVLNMIINKISSVEKETINNETPVINISNTIEEIPAETIEKLEQESIENNTDNYINPKDVTLSIIWDAYNPMLPTNTARLLTDTKKENKTEENINFTIIDDYTYIPLRILLEKFNEKVSWNDKEKQAYVERDGKLIPIEGKLINNVTYAKIRSFETLGYIFIYEQSDTTKTVKMYMN